MALYGVSYALHGPSHGVWWARRCSVRAAGWAQEGTDHPWTPPTPNPPLIDGGMAGYIHDVPLKQ